MSVSLIGSFRRHYDDVLRYAADFQRAGVQVMSPSISRIINTGAMYPRFASDDEELSDYQIQADTLEKILSSSFVYVVASKGYIGRTTAYELGRVHERGIPVYYSEMPDDLPIDINPNSILDPSSVARLAHGTLTQRS